MSLPVEAESQSAAYYVSSRRLPRLQELSLIGIIVLLGAALSYFGWRYAMPGHPNLFSEPR